MAISEKKRAANRRNAQKSTGPRTEEGKAASSMNAVKHGLYAETLVLPGEDPEALEALFADVHEQYRPVGVMERFLCRRLTMLLWRMERVARVEVAACEHAVAQAGRSLQDMPFAAAVSDMTERGIVAALGRYERQLAASLKETLAQLDDQQERRDRDAARRALADLPDRTEEYEAMAAWELAQEAGEPFEAQEPEELDNEHFENEPKDGATMRVGGGFGWPPRERDPHDCEVSGACDSGDGGGWH